MPVDCRNRVRPKRVEIGGLAYFIQDKNFGSCVFSTGISLNGIHTSGEVVDAQHPSVHYGENFVREYSVSIVGVKIAAELVQAATRGAEQAVFALLLYLELFPRIERTGDRREAIFGVSCEGVYHGEKPSLKLASDRAELKGVLRKVAKLLHNVCGESRANYLV